MVQAGVCAVYAPSFLVRQLNEFEPKQRHLVELELSPQRRSQERMSRDIFLVKRSRDEESKVMKAVTKIVRQTCK
jgi:DNA-binding transcriptional LysR family regulator